MKKFIVILALISFVSVTAVQAQTTLSNDDKLFIKKQIQIKKLNHQLDAKQEEMRIAVSAVRTTYRDEIDAIQLLITTAEDELEALTQ